MSIDLIRWGLGHRNSQYRLRESFIILFHAKKLNTYQDCVLWYILF